jgi:type IV secretion system protein VirB9
MNKFALALATALLGSAVPACAALLPTPAAGDPRMRTVQYQPDNVVNVVTTLGATLAIQFAADEAVADIWVSDSDKKDCRVVGAGNVALVKPAVKLAPAPMFVRTQKADGSFRLYTFQLEVRDGDAPAADTMFRIRFVYPAEQAAARRAAAVKAAQQTREVQARRALAAAPPPGPPNYRYVAQGDANLLPSAMWDDGQQTHIRWPGNVRVPAVYVIGPDGKEMLANFSVENGEVTVHQTDRMFRFRDGDTVLCVFNRGWDPVGANPGTGTTSPSVVREIKGASR